VVSGQGVREGVALRLMNLPLTGAAAVKEASLASLTMRFDGWQAEPARRRREVAAALVRALEPRADAKLVDALDHGARLLDIGRSVDFVDRHEHVADILLATELNGFTHEDIAFLSGLVRRAGDRHADARALDPLVAASDRPWLDRGAVLLALADEIEQRVPRGHQIAISCRITREVRISVPQLPSWRSREIGQRFERAFGKPLVIQPGAHA
jgi:exopolyphosphatase/guanosine-5'-triphosphate,3'-diphosphate pyrophosphatase